MSFMEYVEWYRGASSQSKKGNLYSLLYNARNEISYSNQYVKFQLKDKRILDIIVIGFNNYRVIEKQIDMIDHFVTDHFQYVVFDNSSDEIEAQKIQKLCQEKKKAYVRLKSSRCPASMPSENHAIAVNYVYRNYILKRKPEYFVLLDHDIFPVTRYSFVDKLKKQPFYGYYKKENSGICYLWPGFSIFRGDYVYGKKINFMTNWGHGGDTGSSNYIALYKHYSKSQDSDFASFKRITLFDDGNPQGDVYSIMDGAWIHMLNGSKWNKEATNYSQKQDIVFDMLDKFKSGELAIENFLK